MKDELFNDLVDGIKEAGAWLRGEKDLPGERISFVSEPDPRAIRKRLNLSQDDFAELLGISVRTLQNWEQGRRSPTGPAVKLLKIADRYPNILLKSA
jgi:putative transcriptional regulator